MEISELKNPQQLKELEIKELNELCQQIRNFLI